MPLAVWQQKQRQLALADATVCLNSFDACALRRFGYGKICSIPDPVPDDYGVMPDSPERENAALYVGRLAIEKNIEPLIQAFSVVVEQVPSARLWLTANPSSLSIAEIEKYIRNTGLHRHIQLLPVTDDPRTYYQRASFLVLPSFREGFGMVIIEAKKFSLPTVMFDLENNETVKNGFDGLKVPVGDFTDFARSMILLFTNTAFRKELGDNAFSSSGQYNLSSIATCWDELFSYVSGAGESAMPFSPERCSKPEFGAKVSAAIEQGQREFALSFYGFVYRHPVFLTLMRSAKEHLPRGGIVWSVLRYAWFKLFVPVVSPVGRKRQKTGR